MAIKVINGGMTSRLGIAKRWLSDRWGWVIVFGCAVLFFVTFGFMLSFTVVFVALREEFGSTVTQTAWVGSIPFGLCCICSPLISLLIERFGPRAIAATGSAISSVGIIATSFMPSLPPMFLSFSFAFGLGSGMMLFGCFNVILTYFPLKNSTRGTVIPMAGTNLGMFTLGPVIYFLQTQYGWRNMLRIFGSLIGVVCIPLSLVLLKPPSESNSDDQRTTETTRCASPGRTKYSEITASKDDISDNHNMTIETQNEPSRPAVPRELDEIINENNVLRKVERQETDIQIYESDSHRSPACRIIHTLLYPDVVLLSFSVFGYGLVNSFVVIQMANFLISIGHSEERGAQALMVIGVSLMVGKILLVLFGDMAPFPKLGFFPIASVIGMGVLLCFLWVHRLIVVLALTAILGVAVMSTGDSLPYSVCNQTFGVAIGTQALPIVAFFHGSGFILASFLGESVDGTGSYNMAFISCIGVYIVCALFCILVPIYQKYFAKDRHIIDLSLGCRNKEKREDKKMTREKEKAQKTGKEEELAQMVTDQESSSCRREEMTDSEQV